ncbi:protein VACUOLELESS GAMETOPHYTES-like [Daucus carota subsp. sativus]|uniref:protein VACUOLELESS GAMETOPHYTES-like n=1 Tax=Daucus carota subsp. sativus TaxID=79200 RepID=UPI003083806A
MENSDDEINDDDIEREFEHGSHKHTLRVHHAREPYKCNGCKMPGSRICFKCVDELCHFHLHPACFAAETVPTLRHTLLDDCDFEYHESPPQVAHHGGDFPYCDACGLDILGFRYRCFTKSHGLNPHDLHPTCMNLEKDMEYRGIKLKLKNNEESRCLHCGEKYPTEGCIRFTGWKWVAKDEKHWDWGFPFCLWGRKICYHVKCMNEMQAPGYSRKK